MQISRELLQAKRQQAADERDRYLAAANAQVGRIQALDDLLAVLDLPATAADAQPKHSTHEN